MWQAHRNVGGVKTRSLFWLGFSDPPKHFWFVTKPIINKTNEIPITVEILLFLIPLWLYFSVGFDIEDEDNKKRYYFLFFFKLLDGFVDVRNTAIVFVR